ncbi:helix-turn-helix domain-containing protein [Streptomyces sp. NBC_00882]|uniref:PucR family transcriptional regulator n=1 Tax=Streptomyces TaxID=1883 RepID=UPI003869B5A3|nr:helix-turn-helix domain-containing protein [Streptomyces sp. NBC_00882]WSZ57853.1 helix-turn-helix domain-containing protein [Streptomyces canus]
MDPFVVAPHRLADFLRPHLDEIADEVAREVQLQVPEYARPADDAYVRTIRAGVIQALTLFVDRIADTGRDRDREHVVHTYQEIGRGESGEGRGLEVLQAALRLGGRAAWRRMMKAADELALDSTEVAALADAAFTHMHEIMQAATEGHTEARLRSTGELQRRRKRLLDLLLADLPASAETVEEVARTARWPLPQRVAVIAVGGPEREDDERLLPAGVLADMTAVPARLVIPDPDRTGPAHGRTLAPALQGWPAAVGPTVPLAQIADSLRWAARALSLMKSGVLPGEGVIRCADHLSTLILYADEPLVQALSYRVLAPLAGIPAPQRDRLAETLLAWLQNESSVGGTAQQLHLHPQTVRYRMRQLEKLFGDSLRDSETRFELELALRAGAASGPSSEHARPAPEPVLPPVSRVRSTDG